MLSDTSKIVLRAENEEVAKLLKLHVQVVGVDIEDKQHIEEEVSDSKVDYFEPDWITNKEMPWEA